MQIAIVMPARKKTAPTAIKIQPRKTGGGS
jgi:hypothetical protein